MNEIVFLLLIIKWFKIGILIDVIVFLIFVVNCIFVWLGLVMFEGWLWIKMIVVVLLIIICLINFFG